jgi:sulfur carrier protein ThiS adenylyltransferase
MTTILDSEKRYSRQKDIVPLGVLINTEISVIGVGAIGRNVSLQLAAMGIQNLHLLDFDKVEESNIASQGYLEGDIDKYKVDATGKLCKKINATINLRAEKDRFRLNTTLGQIVFLCVDSIDTRSHIWQAVRDNVKFFVDGRMSAEVYRVLTVTSPKEGEYYDKTLFPEADAQQGACTAKTTIFCANAVSSWMVSNFAKWMREMPIAKDMLVNMLSNEIIMNSEDEVTTVTPVVAVAAPTPMTDAFEAALAAPTPEPVFDALAEATEEEHEPEYNEDEDNHFDDENEEEDPDHVER